mmetsp:Transcript_378/g.824  ORF Transcript_378/g.824 Transcript_378/m.824 type:complete len:91 (+) Transcript_378:46-318(+)
MSSVAERVQALCSERLSTVHCECVDFSDGNCDGSKLDLVVVSAEFVGTALLARHRKVNGVIKDGGLMDGIHALTIKAWTPEQWEKKKGQN